MPLRSFRTETFRRQYDQLPELIQSIAKAMYQLFLRDQWHPSFQRKKPRALEHHSPPIYEFRITRQYRALAQVDGETYYWIFIGDHTSFDRQIRRFSS